MFNALKATTSQNGSQDVKWRIEPTSILGLKVTHLVPDISVDAQLPPMIEQTVQSVLSILLYVIMIGVIIHWFLVAVVPLTVLFLLLYIVFRVGLRELKRLQNISMSPLLSHTAASVQGLHSVHAYNMADNFILK